MLWNSEMKASVLELLKSSSVGTDGFCTGTDIWLCGAVSHKQSETFISLKIFFEEHNKKKKLDQVSSTPFFFFLLEALHKISVSVSSNYLNYHSKFRILSFERKAKQLNESLTVVQLIRYFTRVFRKIIWILMNSLDRFRAIPKWAPQGDMYTTDTKAIGTHSILRRNL